MQCILYKIYFWKVFHMNYNWICTPICTKIFILAKSGCYSYLSWAQAYQPFPVLKTPGYDCWRLGYAPCLVTRRARSGPTGGEILLTCAYWDEMEERVVPRSNSFLGSWPLPFIQEREGHIWNGTCDSPTIWHWREPVIHIIMGCNW
jgi:hypothetical protein